MRSRSGTPDVQQFQAPFKRFNPVDVWVPVNAWVTDDIIDGECQNGEEGNQKANATHSQTVGSRYPVENKREEMVADGDADDGWMDGGFEEGSDEKASRRFSFMCTDPML